MSWKCNVLSSYSEAIRSGQSKNLYEEVSLKTGKTVWFLVCLAVAVQDKETSPVTPPPRRYLLSWCPLTLTSSPFHIILPPDVKDTSRCWLTTHCCYQMTFLPICCAHFWLEAIGFNAINLLATVLVVLINLRRISSINWRIMSLQRHHSDLMQCIASHLHMSLKRGSISAATRKMRGQVPRQRSKSESIMRYWGHF